MGQATGKLTISHVDHKTKNEAAVEHDVEVQKPVSAAQIVNGDVKNAPDLPAIDADIEPVAAKNNVAGEAHGEHPAIDSAGTEHGLNGSLNTAEAHDTSSADPDKLKEEKSAKKTKNPLVWIQRRLSKRTSTSKKGADKAGDEAVATVESEKKEEDAQTLEQAETIKPAALATEVMQVVEAASSLVDQVLNTSMAQQVPDATPTLECASVPVEAVEQQPEPTHETVTEPTEPVGNAPVQHPPSMEETAPTEATLVNSTAESVPSESEQQQQQLPEVTAESDEVKMPTEQIENESVLDTNNTNSESVENKQPTEQEADLMASTEKPVEHEVSAEADHHVNGLEAFEHHDDAVAAKLANLELTNGHSEHPATINGVDVADVAHADVAHADVAPVDLPPVDVAPVNVASADAVVIGN